MKDTVPWRCALGATARLFQTVLLFVLVVMRVGAASEAPRVDIILWFDTEDYLLPASDDAVKRLAMLLSDRGIRGTFKVVGEKARVLERRGRADVIAALKPHDIGFHANYHSVHPTPSEYLADCGLLDGVAEFIRREGPGAADVRRIFQRSTLVCYGQPGSSWAAQAMAALPQIGVAPHGVPCYVDDGTHVGVGHQPFWFEGVLTVYDMGPNWTRMDLHDRNALEPAEKKVAEIAARLRSGGGGLISIYYHPCEWVHREFWDGVNFRRGANPPRELWKAPPQLPAEETDAAFAQFGQYLDFMRRLPGIRFVTAGDLPEIYPDHLRTDGVSRELLQRIASDLVRKDTLDMAGGPGVSLSVADQFQILTEAMSQLIAGGTIAFPLRTSFLLGPDSACESQFGAERIHWPALRDATRDVQSYLQTEHRIPARVFIGADALDPGTFLRALAEAYESWMKEGHAPDDGVAVRPYKTFLPATHVAADTPQLFGGWIIHRAGFRAPKILEVARLQTWTLKPAVRQ